MTSEKQSVTLLGLPDRFVAAEIETQAAAAFDAAQYSFFGDLSAVDSGLEGALEDGLEAPPPEDGLSNQDYGFHGGDEDPLPLDEEEDLSVASVFRNQLGLGLTKTPPAKRVDPDDDAALDALLTDPLSVARKQLRDYDYDQRELPAEMYPEAVSTAAIGQSPALFGTVASSYGLFDGYSNMLDDRGVDDAMPASSSITVPTAPAQQPSPSPSAAGSSLLQASSTSSQQPKVMTLEELEARMLRNVEATAATAGAQAVAGASGGRVTGSYTPSQQQPAALLSRPLPGMPVSSEVARGPAAQGPRMPTSTAGPAPSPGAFPAQQQQQPGPHHGLPLQLPPAQGVPPPPHQHQHPMHAATVPHGPMQMPPQPPGAPGAGMYPPPPMMMMGAVHMGVGPQQPIPMYNGNGGMPPQHHQHHGLAGPGMLPPGAMPPPYGPGAQYPPRGPMPPYGLGPMAMGAPPPYMHDGFPMRPMGGPPGMPGPMHGMPPRPGPFGYGTLSLGSGPGQPQQQQQPSGPSPQRPAMLAGQQPPPPGSGVQRPSPGTLGPGALGPRPGQPRPVGASQPATDFGQQHQFARVNSGPGAPSVGPVALAAVAAAAGRAGGAASGPGGRLGGRWMRPDDVEYVIRSMLYTVANGVPYVEDYYYQAFVHKHVSQPLRQQLSPGAFPMAAPFVPESLRELSEDQMSMMRLDASARAKFVEGLQGLGKIVLSNIRTPKVLMDLTDRGGAKSSELGARTSGAAEGESGTAIAKGGDQPGRSSRPLEQEPLLAARIMIEDCMNLLLDVDDVDRLANHMAAREQAQQRAVAVAAVLPLPGRSPPGAAVVATAGVNAPGIGPYVPSSATPLTPTQLRQRRELLLAGITGAFRLPSSPSGIAAGDAVAEDPLDASGAGLAQVGSPLGDGVLIRILALSKGRSVVARALLAIAPPASLVASPSMKPARQQPQQEQVGEPAAEAQGNGSAVVAVQGQDSTAVAGVAAPQEDAPVAGGTDDGEGSLLGLDASSPYVLLWGTLRSAWMVFGTSLLQDIDAATERPFLEATSRLAAALREALLRLPTARDVVDAAAAFNAGCQQHVEALCQANPAMTSSMEATLLPLAQTRAAEPPPSSVAGPSGTAAPAAWLGEALAALVTRASQVGLATAGTAPAADGKAAREAGVTVAAQWRREYAALHVRLSRHLAALSSIHGMAVSSNNAEALAVVRALSCRLLVNAMVQHTSPEEAQELKAALQALTA